MLKACNKLGVFIICFFLATLLTRPAAALEDPGAELKKTGITTQLGQKIDLDTTLLDSSGNRVTIRSLLSGGKPAIIIPVYFNCPRMCGFVLAGMADVLNQMELKLNEDYKVLAISFDNSDRPRDAKEKEQFYRAKLRNGIDKDGWRFLVGDGKSAEKLMGQLGFAYLKDGKEYAHSPAIMVLTSQGEISQYFTGIEFPSWDLRLALIEASKGAIGSPMDHILLYCFKFDPTKGKYTWAAFNVMRAGGFLTLLALGSIIYYSSGKRTVA